MVGINEVIWVGESKSFSDFMKYLKLLLKEGLYGWVWYSLIVKVFGGKRFCFITIKSNSELIGGFFVTPLPLAKYKMYNWLNKGVQFKFNELVRSGYQYFCCFVVKKSFRNKGIGSIAFESYIKQNQLKIWFTSSPGAVSFYLRQGARLCYQSSYDIYCFETVE